MYIFLSLLFWFEKKFIGISDMCSFSWKLAILILSKGVKTYIVLLCIIKNYKRNIDWYSPVLSSSPLLSNPASYRSLICKANPKEKF